MRRVAPVKPQIIIGSFGRERAELMASDCYSAVIIDLKSQFILRGSMGRIAGNYLSPSLFRIALLLAVVPGLATYAQIEEQLWGDRADGGPDNLRPLISIHLCNLRRRLSRLNVLIETEWGIGWRLCDALLEAHP